MVIRSYFITSKSKKGFELVKMIPWLLGAIFLILITASVIYIIKKRIFG